LRFFSIIPKLSEAIGKRRFEVMEPEISRQLARIEGRINTIAQALAFVLPVTLGYGIYFLFVLLGDDWAAYYGIGSALVSGFAFELRMRSLDKLILHHDDEADS